MSGPDYSIKVPVLLNLIQVNLVSFYLPALDYLSGVVTARIIKKGIFFAAQSGRNFCHQETRTVQNVTDYRLLVPSTSYSAPSRTGVALE